jgi:thiol-disulfide isomerase/thioredoxin
VLKYIKEHVRETLLEINEHYISINQKNMEHEESLIDTEHLKSVTEYNELFRQLTENYKGKVIYLDFWGTGCGTCRENMMLMGDTKEALKEKLIQEINQSLNVENI